MGLKAALMEWLQGVEDDEDGLGESLEGDENPDALGDDEGTDAPADDAAGIEAGAGADDSEQSAADAEQETLPQSEVSLDELRDALNELAAENEALRTRIAELGGDAEIGSDDVLDDVVDDEVADDEDDDEKAQEDLDRQHSEIAALRGDEN